MITPNESFLLENVYTEPDEGRSESRRLSQSDQRELEFVPVNRILRVVETPGPHRQSLSYKLPEVSKRSSEPPNPPSEYFSVTKRNPGCMRRCLQIGVLHPAQCHFLC